MATNDDDDFLMKTAVFKEREYIRYFMKMQQKCVLYRFFSVYRIDNGTFFNTV